MNATAPKETVHSQEEFLLTKIAKDWKGKSLAAAVTAASEIGQLVAGNMVGYERAKSEVERGFNVRLMNEKYWPTVYEAFRSGRSSMVTDADLRERYFSVAVNGNLIEPTVFEWTDPSKIPVRDWLFGKHLIRRHVSATIASGAVGKTSLKIVEALALVTGRALLGQEVPKKLNVWLFNLEDDMIELRRRVSAAMIHYNIKPADIGDRLHIDGEKSLLITKTDHNGTQINEPVVEAIVEAIQALEIDVLIVDPFISSHDAAESDSGAMDLVMKSGWVRVARDGNCAVELCHHTTKADASTGTATAMSGRGSGAVVFACRSVMVLNPMSADDAKKAGLASPSGYFSAINDKENLAPPSGGSRDWYKMESVSLGNGGTGNLASSRVDSIGVVTRWHWPSNASFTEGVMADQLQAIKNLLKVGEHRKDSQSTDWAGYAVGKILDLGTSKDTMGTDDKRRVTRMLDAWLTDGQLKEFATKVDGHKRAFLTAP